MTIDAIAQHHELGQPVNAYRWNKSANRTVLILLILLLPFVLVASIVFLGIPLLVFLYLVIRQIRRLTASKPVIYLFQHGLIDCRQGKPKVLRYDNIEVLRFSIESLGRVFREEYCIQTSQGKTWTIFHTVDGIRAIGTFLQQKAVENQLPRAIAQLQQDEILDFQKLKLGRQGIHKGHRFLPWAEVERVGVETTRTYKHQFVNLYVWRKQQSDAWGYVQRDRFPNLALFLLLANLGQTGQLSTSTPLQIYAN